LLLDWAIYSLSAALVKAQIPPFRTGFAPIAPEMKNGARIERRLFLPKAST